MTVHDRVIARQIRTPSRGVEHLKKVEEGIWLVTFVDYELGYVDLEEKLCNLG